MAMFSLSMVPLVLAEVAARPHYRPFIDPVNLHDRWWLTLLPLALGISLAYKAIRVKTFDTYLRQVLVMTGQIIAGMALLAAALFVFVEVIVPRLS